ncbi:MAG: hypothetical protein RR324_05390 [Cellulosilyticaceae bacterium]
MIGLKKQLVKSFINLKVVSNKPGELIIQSNAMTKIDEGFKIYDKEGIELVKLLDGIQDVTADYQLTRITIKYDISKLTPHKVMKWVEIIIDVSLEYLEVIKEKWEIDMAYVLQVLRVALTKRIKEVG